MSLNLKPLRKNVFAKEPWDQMSLNSGKYFVKLVNI